MEEKIILPSNGVFYENIPTELTIRSLTTSEEQLLYGSTSDTTIDRIIANCIVEPKNFPIDELIPADKMFILMKIRIVTYGQDYNQYVYCPYCSYEGVMQVDLDTLPCEEINDDLKVPLKLTLKVSKDELELRVLTEKDYKNIKSRANKMAKKLGIPFSQIEHKLRFAKQIKAINGRDVDSYEAEKYYQDMHVRDVRYVESALASVKVGYQGMLDCECPSCKKELTVPFEMTSEFLMPTFQDDDFWN
jgi:hypothetical protein